MPSAFLQWLYADAGDVPQTGYEVSPNSDPMSPKFTRPRDSARGSAVSAFQAGRGPTTMAAPVPSRRWLQCFSRKYNQTRSTGLISGEYGGSQTSVTLLGITSRLAVCQPARSSTMTACSFAGSVAANCARNSSIALAETSGNTRAKASPVAG